MQLDYQTGHDDAYQVIRKSSRVAAIDAQKRIAGHIKLRKRYEQDCLQAQVDPLFSPQISLPPSPSLQAEQSTPMDCSTPDRSDNNPLNILANVALESRVNDLMFTSYIPTRGQPLAPPGLLSPPATIMELGSPYQSPEQRTSEFSTPLRPVWTPLTPPHSISPSSAGKSEGTRRKVMNDCERESNELGHFNGIKEPI
jgi:hypothetical protein